MFCTKCGVQLPSQAKLCLSCGEPQQNIIQQERQAPQRLGNDNPRYELCEFNSETHNPFLGFGWHYQLEIVVIGPTGRTIVHSEKLAGGFDGNSKGAQYRINELAGEFAQNGWDALTTFSDGSLMLPRFRRRVQ